MKVTKILNKKVFLINLIVLLYQYIEDNGHQEDGNGDVDDYNYTIAT